MRGIEIRIFSSSEQIQEENFRNGGVQGYTAPKRKTKKKRNGAKNGFSGTSAHSQTCFIYIHIPSRNSIYYNCMDRVI